MVETQVFLLQNVQSFYMFRSTPYIEEFRASKQIKDI